MMALSDAVPLAASVGRDRRRKADHPGRRRRQSRRRRARQHDLSSARAEGRRCPARALRCVQRCRLAAKAHELGEGAIFTASFNTRKPRILPAVRLRGQGRKAVRRQVRRPPRRAAATSPPTWARRPCSTSAASSSWSSPTAASAWIRGSSRASASTSPRRGSSWSRAAAISAAASTSSSSPADLRGRLPGLDVTGPGELHLDQAAAAGLPARRRDELDATHWRLKDRRPKGGRYAASFVDRARGAVLLSAPASAQSSKTLRVVMHRISRSSIRCGPRPTSCATTAT